MADICGISGFADMLSGTIIPLSGIAAISTGAIIGIAFAASQAIANPKLSVWAKTEAVQLALSLLTVFMLAFGMGAFCSIRMDEVASLFSLTSGQISLYDAAGAYLADAAHFSLEAAQVVRYHLEAYSILAALSGFECEFGGIGCLFGYSGMSVQPLGGYGVHQAALSTFLSSALVSDITALNFLFILLFVYKGFVLFFLPMGIFVRSMPYLRSFGALLIAVSLSFLMVYPLLLAMFYLMEPVLLAPPLDPAAYDESVFEEHGGTHFSAEAATAGADAVAEDFFPDEPHLGDPVGAIRFAACAFIAAVFLPTAALIATLASVSYIARLYGEEIDLGRIVQMV